MGSTDLNDFSKRNLILVLLWSRVYTYLRTLVVCFIINRDRVHNRLIKIHLFNLVLSPVTLNIYGVNTPARLLRMKQFSVLIMKVKYAE